MVRSSGRSSDSPNLYHLPIVTHYGLNSGSMYRGLFAGSQQRVLSRIFTLFPIMDAPSGFYTLRAFHHFNGAKVQFFMLNNNGY